MSELGLNEHHQSTLNSYLKFSRYYRQQNLKSVQLSFQDVLDARLLDSTYTKQEVEDLITSLQNLIVTEMEAELISFSHINVLLLTQLFTQAQQWHLRLNVDLSELQNKKLLEIVKSLEKDNFSGEKTRLKPINESSKSVELLRLEIERLKEVNNQLQASLELKDKDFMMANEKYKEIIKENDHKLQQFGGQPKKDQETSTESLPIEKQSSTEKLLGDYEAVLREQLSAELITMKEEMATVQSQLTLAEQELEQKFNQTAAYNNMKRIIDKKNQQIRELRAQLSHPPEDSNNSN
ncbi:unnamed protein product [Bemisia tabaci]|uniref:Leucine zipper transcription factor-like protein 1 n=1 Tax=Bemisia tabaci TaxID=7038 RepID=A0A9P0AKH0_BEMTA|nr:PREDICTED: leucine zipper transcription factor-like protein 1 [Bemisia tabaci]CAH0393235.1 unnamed protein product [Bemisia tabaci]